MNECLFLFAVGEGGQGEGVKSEGEGEGDWGWGDWELVMVHSGYWGYGDGWLVWGWWGKQVIEPFIFRTQVNSDAAAYLAWAFRMNCLT